MRKAIRGEHRRVQETPRLVSAERELVSIMGKQEGFTSFCKQSGYTEKDGIFSSVHFLHFYIFWNLYLKDYPAQSHGSFTKISFQLFLPSGQISWGLGHQEPLTVDDLADSPATDGSFSSPI